jgi:HTH-type transcriptional regulator, transcriptional repressor of NAD biosynthesis genes
MPVMGYAGINPVTGRRTITRGLVVGKFAPPHKGHSFLIEEARLRCDELTVLVVDTPVADFDVSAEQRALWLAEMHSEVKRIGVMPDIMFDNRSDLWADYTEAFLGYVPDIVFSSEGYGRIWAEALGCRHYDVDVSRVRVPVSGTAVRQDPIANLDMLDPIVRAHFVKRVVVCGAESTGTTTLAKALAAEYKTQYVPEFGRVRDERRVAKGLGPHEWESTEFAYTAMAQQVMEDRLARKANKVLVCDTDALATALWHERYHGYADPATMHIAEQKSAGLYLVTDYNGVAEEEDGFRFEMHKRPAMHRRFIEELERLQRPYVVVTGTHEERMRQAVNEIDLLLGVENVNA